MSSPMNLADKWAILKGHSRYCEIIELDLPSAKAGFLGITEAFKADGFSEKINLGVGAYRR